ncbi:hypothetical protein ACS0TY_030886 [Phlomoides rotata]
MARWNKKLCPRIQKILERNMDKVADCIPIKSIDIHYQVSCFDGGQYTVDLQQWVCYCRAWQFSGIPCTHAICAILHQCLDPTDFVHEAYSVETYLKTYENPIFGIRYEVLWGESMYIPPLPPNFGTRPKRGRRATKRRLEPDEKANKSKKDGTKQKRVRRQQTTVTCSKCKIKGHNAAGCKTKGNEDARGSCPKPTEIAPPKLVTPQLIDESEITGLTVDTQQSQVANKEWYKPPSTPNMQPPLVHQQMQGPPAHVQLQPRVQIRAPPPYAPHLQGQFRQIRAEKVKQIIVDGDGQKFMDLSSQGSNAEKKGKKKDN